MRLTRHLIQQLNRTRWHLTHLASPRVHLSPNYKQSGSVPSSLQRTLPNHRARCWAAVLPGEDTAPIHPNLLLEAFSNTFNLRQVKRQRIMTDAQVLCSRPHQKPKRCTSLKSLHGDDFKARLLPQITKKKTNMLWSNQRAHREGFWESFWLSRFSAIFFH